FPSSFAAAVLKRPRKTWRPLYKNTSNAFCANIWVAEVHSGLPSLLARGRRPNEKPTHSTASGHSLCGTASIQVGHPHFTTGNTAPVSSSLLLLPQIQV